LLIHVARMRIERGDHALDRAFDQLAVVGLLDIVGPDPLEHVAEQVELRVGIGAGCGLCHRDEMRALGAGDDKGQTRACDRAEEKSQILAHRSRILLAVVRHNLREAASWPRRPQTHYAILVASRPISPGQYGPSGHGISKYLAWLVKPAFPTRRLGAEAAFGT